MKEIVLDGPYDFKLKQSPVPVIEAGEVLVKVAFCAVCATDIRILEGKKKKGISYPAVIGHEFSGTICETGSGVSGLQAGVRVAVSPIISCGHCPGCLAGKENLCQNRLTLGYQFNGGFAEFVRIPAIAVQNGNIIRIADAVSFEEAALIEPLACCINGMKRARLDSGDTVLIIGAGMIGQLLLLLCKLSGVRFVAVSDPVGHRRSRAKKYGADLVLDPVRDDVGQAAARIYGFSKIILACAAASTINNVMELCAMGAIVVLFSGFSGDGSYSLDLNNIHYKEIELTGSSAYTKQNYLTAVELIESGSIDVRSLISNIFPIEKFFAAYEQQKSGNGFKILIKP